MTAQSSRPKYGFAWWSRAMLTLVIILVAATCGAGAVARSNLMKKYPAPGQMVDAGGFNMHIHCTGEGSPTVILAGGLDDFSITWSLVQPTVAKTTRVCSYDRAGLGWSEASPAPRTSENMVKELHTMLVNAKIESPFLMV